MEAAAVKAVAEEIVEAVFTRDSGTRKGPGVFFSAPREDLFPFGAL